MLRAGGTEGFCHGLEVQMLVITRREGEEVVIGDPSNPIGVVRIASIKGDRVRVAFDFPRSIDVHRREVAEQILAGGTAGSHTIEIVVGAGAEHVNGHAAPATPAVK
jgi:carbon storage regulator